MPPLSNRKVVSEKSLVTAGKPQWYKDLWDAKEKRIRITPRQRVVPYLLRLAWQGNPLYYSKQFGWTFEAPADVKFASPRVCDTTDAYMQNETQSFYRLPHKDGEKNTGNPLSKQFTGYFKKGILTSSHSCTALILEKASQITYWTSARARIAAQFVHNNTILPHVVAMGTVTRRAVEALWMTAANAKENSIGLFIPTKAPNSRHTSLPLPATSLSVLT